jgi:hypothetical protein
MRRVPVVLLSAILFAWQPRQFALDLLMTLPTIGMRGIAAVIELVCHAAVAALSVAASWSLWTSRPHGAPLASAALVASALTSVQSLYWSVLPGHTMPGDRLPLAVLAVLHAAAWLVYLARSRPGSA